MNQFMEVLSNNLLEIVSAAIVAIAGYIGVKIKAMVQEHLNDQTKEKVAKTVVKAIQQMYKDLNGEEKLNKAIETITEMLNEKGISVTELEIRMLIEEAVQELNLPSFGK